MSDVRNDASHDELRRVLRRCVGLGPDGLVHVFRHGYILCRYQERETMDLSEWRIALDGAVTCMACLASEVPA